jgi:hypothetical protein
MERTHRLGDACTGTACCAPTETRYGEARLGHSCGAGGLPSAGESQRSRPFAKDSGESHGIHEAGPGYERQRRAVSHGEVFAARSAIRAA